MIEFFWRSPIKSFATMLDVFRYLENGRTVPADIEHELFDHALGDNDQSRVYIRATEVGGIRITANSLFMLTEHLKKYHFVRRRPHKTRGPYTDPDEQFVVAYDLTPSGKNVLRVLEGIERGRSRSRGEAR
jgi:hypothetical protein